MQLVQKTWQPSAGLQKWEVAKLDPSSGYVTKCVMHWDTGANAEKAFASDEGKKILADIPNYCNVEPEKHAGEVVGGH